MRTESDIKGAMETAVNYILENRGKMTDKMLIMSAYAQGAIDTLRTRAATESELCGLLQDDMKGFYEGR